MLVTPFGELVPYIKCNIVSMYTYVLD